MQEQEVELQVSDNYMAKEPKMAEKRWDCIQYTLVILTLVMPIILLLAWYISLAIIDKTVHETTLSGTIGMPTVKVFNIIVAAIMCFFMSWITLIRNIQIRVIFDRFPAYNVKSKENENEIELTDYICPCCCHCRSDACGGPIYHNKARDGNCVRNCKYYATTFRGFNFITTFTNIVAWISLVAVFIFDVYTATAIHLALTGVMAATIFFYQFTHSATFCKQRLNEAKLSNKSCREMCYYLDVIFCFFMPIFAIIMYMTHIASASYGSRIFTGDDAPEDVDYVFEWIAFTTMVIYYMILSYIFGRDNVTDELTDYAAFSVRCCFI